MSTQETINQNTKDGKTDWDAVIKASTTIQLNVSNSLLNIYANTIAEESSGDKTESYALASTIINLSKHRNKDLLKTLQTEGIYGYKNGGNNPNYKNNSEHSMEAAINSLTGGIDYSNGAIRWDGFDLAGRGFNHIKERTDGAEISDEHFNQFKAAWPDSYLRSFSGGNFTSFATNFASAVHVATEGANKGRCLLISTGVHGKTMFWGINKDPIIHRVQLGYAIWNTSETLRMFAPFLPSTISIPIPCFETIHVNAGFKSWKGL